MSISKLHDILLRALSDPNYTAKGQALTFAELDTNIKILADALGELALQDVAGVEEYDALVEYSLGPPVPIVTYLGNIYLFVAGTPQTGITPGTDPSVWELASTGLFAHKQGTDMILAEGTPDQIEVADIASRTYAQSQANLKVPIYGAQTIYDQKTFDQIPLLPDADPTDDDHAARKKYVNDSITNAELDFSNGLTESGGEVKLGGATTDSTEIVAASPNTLSIRNSSGTERAEAFVGSGGAFVRQIVGEYGDGEHGLYVDQFKALFGDQGDGAAARLTYNRSNGGIVYTEASGGETGGLREAADYSANYTDRSYTSKEYVDNAVSQVDLNGVQTDDVAIDGDSQWSFTVENSTGIELRSIATIDLEADAPIQITASDLFLEAGYAQVTTPGGAGLEYAADYSGTYSARSLVDKGYADSQLGGEDLNLSGAAEGSLLVRSSGVWVPKPRPAFGAFKMVTNASTNTTIGTAGTFVIGAGTTNITGVPLQDFDDQSGTNNRLRYIGAATRKCLVNFMASLHKPSINARACGAQLYKNGVATGFIFNMWSDTVYDYSGAGTAIVELATNDYLEIWVTNYGAAEAVRMTQASLSAYSID